MGGQWWRRWYVSRRCPRADSGSEAKIVRQQDRVDVLTGKGRSKGYGFVEMEKHADALRVLRWANNNPAVGKLFDEWYKEELKELLEKEKKAEKKAKYEAAVNATK